MYPPIRRYPRFYRSRRLTVFTTFALGVVVFVIFFFVKADFTKEPISTKRTVGIVVRGASYDEYESPTASFLPPLSPKTPPDTVAVTPEFKEATSHYGKRMECYRSAGLGGEENQDLLKVEVKGLKSAASLFVLLSVASRTTKL
ncbi:MAG: hypothetical protein N2234_01240 [Planctomycetota bacterium]|nr:hypothetical protein [Planctomycetota bacterium]